MRIEPLEPRCVLYYCGLKVPEAWLNGSRRAVDVRIDDDYETLIPVFWGRTRIPRVRK